MGGVRVKTENSLSKYNAISPYFTYYAMDIAQNDILDQQENVVANRVYSKKKPDAPYPNIPILRRMWCATISFTAKNRDIRVWRHTTARISAAPAR